MSRASGGGLPRRRKRKRFCACGCKTDISDMSEQARYAPNHRQRAFERRRQVRVRKALAKVGGRSGVNTTARRRQAKPRSIRYTVLEPQDGGTLRLAGARTASSRKRAKAMCPDGYLLVPARFLPLPADLPAPSS